MSQPNTTKSAAESWPSARTGSFDSGAACGGASAQDDKGVAPYGNTSAQDDKGGEPSSTPCHPERSEAEGRTQSKDPGCREAGNGLASVTPAHVGVIAALYAAATLVSLLFLGSLAWGPVQFRISEALCALALITPAAIPGLTLGCAIANAANIVISGTGVLGLLDVVFGSLATFIGAVIAWRLRGRPALALAGPVIANAVIVPAYLPLLLAGAGFYTIPFTSIALDGVYPLMYIFGLVATGLGEAAVMYLLGAGLYRSLVRSHLGELAAGTQGTSV